MKFSHSAMLASFFFSSASGRSPDSPNIIIMQPDDLVFLHEWTPPPKNPLNPSSKHSIPDAGMPNIEGLRQGGLQMMQAYTASPICATSRYSTITGKMPSRATSVRQIDQKKYGDTAQNDPYWPSFVTVPTTKLEGDDCSSENLAIALQNEGYATAMIGKWHLSKYDDSSYTYEGSQDVIKQCGFDSVEGLYLKNLANLDMGQDSDNYSDGTFSHNMEWITYEAIKFINDTVAAESDTPFFMYFNPTVPHKSNGVRAAVESFNCTDTANGTHTDSDMWIKTMTEHGCKEYRENLLERAGDDDNDLGKLWLDDSVGALVQALKDNGVYNNTIFLFQEDHGMDAKGGAYENGIRIPQFISYPDGIVPGTKLEAPVSTIDIAATMLDYAEVTPQYKLDGKSWKGLIDDPEKETDWKENRCLFFEIDQDRAIRCGCYKYFDMRDVPSDDSLQETGLAVETGGMLFNLCGDGDEYVTADIDGNNANNDNREAEAISEEDMDDDLKKTLEDLKNKLQCHLKNTNSYLDPVFSDICESEHPADAPPTLAPSNLRGSMSNDDSWCVDSPPEMMFDGSKMSCSALTDKCSNNRVQTHCRKTCNACDQCLDSIAAKFTVGKMPMQTCSDVSETLCDVDEKIRQTCPMSCGLCPS